MKRIVISVILLCVVAFGCFYSVYAVNDFTGKMLDKIHEVERAFEDGDTEKSAEIAKELGLERKKVDNTIYSAKKKIKKLLEK